MAILSCWRLQLPGGAQSVYVRAGSTGAAVSTGLTLVFGLPQMMDNWERDEYAGRRFMTHVGVNGIGGFYQAVGDQALRASISQYYLDLART